MRGSNGRRRLITGAVFFFASAATACADFGPRPSNVAIAVVPTFSREALAAWKAAAALGLSIDNVRLRFERGDGSVAGDTTITLALGQDSVVIEATVHLNTTPERLTARLELRVGTLALFAGASDILAVAGGVTQAPLIVMQYVGPVTSPPLPLPPLPLPPLPLLPPSSAESSLRNSRPDFVTVKDAILPQVDDVKNAIEEVARL